MDLSPWHCEGDSPIFAAIRPVRLGSAAAAAKIGTVPRERTPFWSGAIASGVREAIISREARWWKTRVAPVRGERRMKKLLLPMLALALGVGCGRASVTSPSAEQGRPTPHSAILAPGCVREEGGRFAGGNNASGRSKGIASGRGPGAAGRAASQEAGLWIAVGDRSSHAQGPAATPQAVAAAQRSAVRACASFTVGLDWRQFVGWAPPTEIQDGVVGGAHPTKIYKLEAAGGSESLLGTATA